MPEIVLDENFVMRCSACSLEARRDIPDASDAERLAFRVARKRAIRRANRLKAARS